jgi:hypothetical protein
MRLGLTADALTSASRMNASDNAAAPDAVIFSINRVLV